jgi:hypothetical protein
LPLGAASASCRASRSAARTRAAGAFSGKRRGSASQAGSGVGLSNTQARLRQLYGAAHRLELLAPETGGLEVVLSIPFKLRGGPTRTVQPIEEAEALRAGALPTVAALPR